MSNIWTAASEGDLARVSELVESGLSPSIADENSYTPLHAAASWGHVDILRYLVSKGGDMNVVDADGETPLFVVETAEMARTVLELGGDQTRRNGEGATAAQSLAEDYPHISLYLRSLNGEPTPASALPPTAATATATPNLDEPTDALLLRVREIMESSERGELSSEETDARLREVVESVVLGQVEVGRGMGEGMGETGMRLAGVREREEEDEGEGGGDREVGGKRRREEAGR